jgi:hypothetical protein
MRKPKQQNEFPWGVNTAVVKHRLSLLPNDKVEEYKQWFKEQARVQPYGNRKAMFIRLYQWCVHLQQKTPSNKR